MISDSHSTAALPLFDLHCDTLYELYKQKLPFDNSRLQITADTAGRFSPYTQVFAVWSEHSLSEEDAWRQFLEILAYKDSLSFPENLRPILAVEGGGLLASRRERLELLAEKGVRLLTLVWQDHCCIGGAWNTDKGLTPFGREAVRGCFSLGILPDLSHASDKMFYECARACLGCGKADHRQPFERKSRIQTQTEPDRRYVPGHPGSAGACGTFHGGSASLPRG